MVHHYLEHLRESPTPDPDTLNHGTKRARTAESQPDTNYESATDQTMPVPEALLSSRGPPTARPACDGEETRASRDCGEEVGITWVQSAQKVEDTVEFFAEHADLSQLTEEDRKRLLGCMIRCMSKLIQASLLHVQADPSVSPTQAV